MILETWSVITLISISKCITKLQAMDVDCLHSNKIVYTLIQYCLNIVDINYGKFWLYITFTSDQPSPSPFSPSPSTYHCLRLRTFQKITVFPECVLDYYQSKMIKYVFQWQYDFLNDHEASRLFSFFLFVSLVNQKMTALETMLKFIAIKVGGFMANIFPLFSISGHRYCGLHWKCCPFICWETMDICMFEKTLFYYGKTQDVNNVKILHS